MVEDYCLKIKRNCTERKTAYVILKEMALREGGSLVCNGTQSLMAIQKH